MKVLDYEGLKVLAENIKKRIKTLDDKKVNSGEIALEQIKTNKNNIKTFTDRSKSKANLDVVLGDLELRTEENKNNIKDKASKTELPTKLSELKSDENNRLVTDTEKDNWNNLKNTKVINDLTTGGFDKALSAEQGVILNNELSKKADKDNLSKYKIIGNPNTSSWQSTESKRNLEDWIGDFDKRTRELKKPKNTTPTIIQKGFISSSNPRYKIEFIKYSDGFINIKSNGFKLESGMLYWNSVIGTIAGDIYMPSIDEFSASLTKGDAGFQKVGIVMLRVNFERKLMIREIDDSVASLNSTGCYLYIDQWFRVTE